MEKVEKKENNSKVRFYSMYANPKKDYKKVDLTRKEEKVYKEIPPFAYNLDSGEVYNKSSQPKIIEVGKVNVWDKIQSYAKDCDIYNILKQFAITNDPTLLNNRVGAFMDLVNMPNNIHDFNNYNKDLADKLAKFSPELRDAVLNGATGDSLTKIIQNEVINILKKTKPELFKEEIKEEVK